MKTAMPMRNHNTRQNLRYRAFAALALAAFVWTFVAAPVAMAATAKPAPAPAKRHFDLPAALRRAKQFEGKKVPTFDYAAAEAKRAKHPLRLHRPDPHQPQTLLTDVAILRRTIKASQITAWKTALKTGQASKADAAWMHIWLGEWELAQNEQPGTARWHFDQAKKLSVRSDRAYGLASYDTAMTAYYEGAYAAAVPMFHLLATKGTVLPGYDARKAANWLRHASACAAYHSERSRAGIPEPPRLDPRCGAAALAACLRSLGQPYDLHTVLRVCRVTGEGSNLQDILDAAHKLGLRADAIDADEKALQHLPKPLVAYVEHDHFIAVTKTDASGVTYLCSDCGAWPGGEVHLTWKQWRLMEAGVYAVVTKPDSINSQVVASIPIDPSDKLGQLQGTPATFDKVATTGSLSGILHHTVNSVGKWDSLNRGRAMRIFNPNHTYTCIRFLQAYYCIIGLVPCPDDGSGPGGSPGGCDEDAMDSGCCPGPAEGDPIDLATGAEEYMPPVDLSVANPNGPAVTWGRMYDSLRSGGASDAEGDPTYECSDYGVGWSQSYNEGVFAPDGGNDTSQKYVFMANGARIAFTPSSIPSADQPSATCTVQPGAPITVEWDYDATSGSNYFTITNPDHSQWLTTAVNPNNNCYRLAEIRNRNNQAIYFNYTADRVAGWPLLSSITTGQNGTGTVLLTIQRTGDGTGSITSISDCYGRSIYYNVQAYPDTYSGQHLDHVSQIVTGHVSAPPDHYVYGYQLLSLASTDPFFYLHTISVPSPTGTGLATATVNYDLNTGFVSNVVDANGYEHSYESVDQNGNPAANTNYARVTISDQNGNPVSAYTTSFDANMSRTSVVNAAGVTTAGYTYADPNDPTKPSSYTDGNGNTWSFTWDQYGNPTSCVSPRGVHTALSYDYIDFATGGLTQIKIGDKAPIALTHNLSNSSLSTLGIPLPGMVGSTQKAITTFSYDGFGNLAEVDTPGDNAASTQVTTFNYTSDGTYLQPEALAEPLTTTDPAGKVTHYRYDAQGLVSEIVDANGNAITFEYNSANQPTVITFAATGQTGSGNTTDVLTYLSPGGALSHESIYDESGIMVRDVAISRDAEGKTAASTCNGITTSVAHDALYRPVAVTNGAGHTATCTYNTAGYLTSINNPGATGSGTADKWQFPSYDNDGNILTRIDGNGTETDYIYNDSESQLTDIHYPADPTKNVHYSYDAYGRTSSKADGVCTKNYEYDDDDLPITVTTAYTGLPSLSISYSYYPDGLRHSMTTPAGNFVYAYNTQGGVANLTNPNGETTSWTYYDNGLLRSQAMANGVTTYYNRNPWGQLTGLITSKADTSLLSQFTGITHDAAGNVLAETATVPALTSLNGTTTYTYDANNQLLQETSQRNSGYTNNFSYDAAGNATILRGSSLSYNIDDQLSGISYDGNGNPATNNGQLLSFDILGNITSFGSVLSAGYLSGGLRAWKQNSSARTYFLYDGLWPVCELDASGNVTAVNTPGVNGVVSRQSGIADVFYTFDPQGNLVQKLDSTGNPIQSNMLDAYGAQATADADPFSGIGGQAGTYRDMETGLVLMGTRYYDPSIGRFLTRDRLGYGGGLNLYAYTDNNPVNGVDSLGLYAGPNPDEDYDEDGSASMLDRIEQGEREGFSALLSAATNGKLDNPDFACDPVFQKSKMTATVGLDLLAVADGAEAIKSLDVGEIFSRDCEGIPPGCFIAGTAVQMADGTTKPIEKIKIGDKVVSRNEKTGKTESKTVSDTIKHYGVPTITLTFSTGEKIVTTAPHPFYVKGKGFVPAARLAAGNAIVTRAGPAVTVTQIEQTTPETVYNLTVDGDHTYFVGNENGGVWVHNVNCTKIRVRHYTNKGSWNAIKQDPIIRAKDQNSVFTVLAKGKSGSARDIEQQLGIKTGKGNAYIEFDAKPGEYTVVNNPTTGATEYVFSGDVSLDGRNPVFKGNW